MNFRLIYSLVGAPLVENCLAGFNSSVFAYGQVFFSYWLFSAAAASMDVFSMPEIALAYAWLKLDDVLYIMSLWLLISDYHKLNWQTGSGKTYTIWGPANALEENISNDQQGLTPRVFQRLFSRISEVKVLLPLKFKWFVSLYFLYLK